MIDEARTYLGSLCRRKHEFNDTGKSLRFKGGDCVKCIQDYMKVYLKEYRSKPDYKEYYKKWCEDNPEKVKAYRAKNKEKREK
jgi:hypothetical protein